MQIDKKNWWDIAQIAEIVRMNVDLLNFLNIIIWLDLMFLFFYCLICYVLTTYYNKIDVHCAANCKESRRN